MKKAILFDLDGTLLDTLGDLHEATNDTLRHFDCPERSAEEIRRFVGNGARMLIVRALSGSRCEDRVQEVLEYYQNYYRDFCAAGKGTTCPYEGIPEALEQLKKDYLLAIVSNKPDPAVKALCQKYFPGIYALGVTEDCPCKPAPDMVKKALKELGAESCLYVGDSEVDVQTAQNAAVPCLSVLWGFRDKEDMVQVGGEYFCDHPSKLAECIEECYGK